MCLLRDERHYDFYGMSIASLRIVRIIYYGNVYIRCTLISALHWCLNVYNARSGDVTMVCFPPYKMSVLLRESSRLF